jgi:glycerol uptake facilitator-like aquaporin
LLAATGVDGSDTASVAFAYGMILATVYRFYPSQSPRSDRVDLHPSISAMRAFGDRANVAGFVAKLGAQVLGAFLAALTIGWIFVADLEDVVTPGSETTTRIWRDGALSSFVFSVGFAYAGNEFNLGITYFVGSCVFGALTNPAATLGATLATLLSGGTVVLDAAFASALLAPLIGGILAGRLPPFVGR